MRDFNLVVVVLLLVVLMRGVCGAASTYLLNEIANGIEHDIREELYLTLLAKSQAFFDRWKVGDIMARTTNDASQVNPMFQPGVEFTTTAVLGTVVPLAFIGFLNPGLLLVPVLFITALAVAVRLHSGRLGVASDVTQERFGAMNAHLTETVAGIQLVESAGQQAQERRHFEENASAYRDAFVRQDRIHALYLPPLLLTLALVGALLQGLLFIAMGTLTVGGLITYLGLVALLGTAIGALGAGLPLIRSGLSGTHRILELLNDDLVLDETRSNYRGRIEGDVVFDRVSFSYDGVRALRDVSFHVRPGEVVTLVGVSGAGKSTLTKLLNRTYEPESGRILLDGVGLREWDLATVRSQVALIKQDVILFSRSVADNIRYVRPEASDEDIVAAAYRVAGGDWLAPLPRGLQTRVGEMGKNLWTGQRQLVALARVLLHDPSILLLDEATASVAPLTEAQVQEGLEVALRGRTSIVIAHRLPTVRKADRIIVLRHGKVVEQGPHNDLI